MERSPGASAGPTDRARGLRERSAFVVLAGGRSRRMGRDKAFLRLDGREMLERILETGGAACGRAVVVANDLDAHAAALARYGWEPDAPDGSDARPRTEPSRAGRADAPVDPPAGTGSDARAGGLRFRRGDRTLALVPDDRPGRGPVAGLEAGLAAADRELCFVAACDLPFLEPAVVRALLRALDGLRDGASDPDRCAVVVRADGRLQPLAAAYAAGARRAATGCLEAGRVRMDDVLERLTVRTMTAGELGREVAVRSGAGGGTERGERFAVSEPARWFTNLNWPEDLQAARRRLGAEG